MKTLCKLRLKYRLLCFRFIAIYLHCVDKKNKAQGGKMNANKGWC